MVLYFMKGWVEFCSIASVLYHQGGLNRSVAPVLHLQGGLELCLCITNQSINLVNLLQSMYFILLHTEAGHICQVPQIAFYRHPRAFRFYSSSTRGPLSKQSKSVL